MRKLLLFIFVFCSTTTLFAQAADTVCVSAGSMTTYTMVQLLGLSVLGMLLHTFVEISKLQQAKTYTTIGDYMSNTWAAKGSSLALCLIVIVIRHEMMNVPTFSNWEGGALALCGYCGSSLLAPVFSFLSKKGINVEQ